MSPCRPPSRVIPAWWSTTNNTALPTPRAAPTSSNATSDSRMRTDATVEPDVTVRLGDTRVPSPSAQPSPAVHLSMDSPATTWLTRRSAGVLAHVTCLPGEYGVGNL